MGCHVPEWQASQEGGRGGAAADERAGWREGRVSRRGTGALRAHSVGWEVEALANVRPPAEHKPHPRAHTQQLQPVHSDKSVSLPHTHCWSSTAANLNNESKKKVGHADGGVRRGSKYPSCPARQPFTDGLQRLLTRFNIFIHISVGVDSAKS